MAGRLIFLTGELEGLEHALAEGQVAVGRHHERDLVLPEDVVSRHHATIVVRDGRCLLRDEGSTNGTFVNDRKVKEQVLRSGDTIEFGLDGPTARFEWDAPNEATKPVEARALRESTEKPGQELVCTSCAESFRVPARELTSASAVFVVLDESAVPQACPRCGAKFDRADLEEMLP